MADIQPYEFKIEAGVVTFRTGSFRAEAGSMLHSGIFNRELTSSFAAGAFTLALFVAMAMSGMDITVAHAPLAALVFAVLFIAARMLVFTEHYLRAVFDTKSREASVTVKTLLKSTRGFGLDEVAGVRLGHLTISPQNPDGVKFVEKIALQHHTVIPGFGEIKEFHTVSLMLKNGRTHMLFSSSNMDEAGGLAAALRRELGLIDGVGDA